MTSPGLQKVALAATNFIPALVFFAASAWAIYAKNAEAYLGMTTGAVMLLLWLNERNERRLEALERDMYETDVEDTK